MKESKETILSKLRALYAIFFLILVLIILLPAILALFTTCQATIPIPKTGVLYCETLGITLDCDDYTGFIMYQEKAILCSWRKEPNSNIISLTCAEDYESEDTDVHFYEGQHIMDLKCTKREEDNLYVKDANGVTHCFQLRNDWPEDSP